MKAKCQFRVASMPEVFQTLKSIEKIANVDKNKIHLDITAFNLLSALLKPEPQKIILSLITKLNKLIE